MHRIEGANNINNLFTDGPPGTTVVAPWLNSVQEEIATAIEEAGITLKKQSNDTSRNQLWAAINLLTTPGNIVVSANNSPYYINDTLKDLIVYVDSSAGDVDIYYPTLANNYHKKINIIHSIGGNLLTVYRNGSDLITKDDMTNIELPKEGNYLEVIGSAISNRWDIIQEGISCQLRLYGYAGYGSTDLKIMRFTNTVENIGNMFSENHSTGYASNTAGLEITANKSGKIQVTYVLRKASAGGVDVGLSLNTSQTTANIFDIDDEDILCMAYGNGSTSPNGTSAWTGYVGKGDILRTHADGGVPTEVYMTATYLGK